ncbi:MAG: sigma-70 family RNA polymerase sigma factor [Tepidimonas ignava]|uniref:sigma-70 family RNA polymerase sigma factor n=1 Tax=Tepidimonas ignava TaxID=114249 RepID=UPI002A35324E|nr:sigma-70 family RNA polymerase sigma factor [Tepidimonas ignava]
MTRPRRPPLQSDYTCVVRAWHAHERELRRHLLRHVGDEALAQDLVQEVFVRALRAGRDFCELRQPRAWLFQVARNTLVDWARRQRPSEPLPQDDAALPATLADGDDDTSPVDALADCLEAVLATLPAADADILRRCDLEGMTQAAYAAQHGLSVPGAKSRLQRARRRLAEALTRQCGVRFERERVCCVVPPPGPPPDSG